MFWNKEVLEQEVHGTVCSTQYRFYHKEVKVMRINNNIMALNAHRQLGTNQAGASKSMEKLSSGFRINRAGDDAAGLAISEKMRGQIRGLKQASRNAQDAISLIQTAEGSLNETHSILQRMRELANQAANDTNVGVDRGEIQKEIDQLVEDLNRIGDTTEFNTKSLLNGGAGLEVSFNSKTTGGADADWISVVGGNASTKTGAINITQAAAASGATTTITSAAGTAGPSSIEVNGTTVNFTGSATASENAAAIREALSAVADELGIEVGGATDQVIITTKSVGSAASLKVDLDPAGGGTSGTGTHVDVRGLDASITTDNAGGAVVIAATDMVASGNTIKVISGAYEGLELKLNGSVMHGTETENLANFDIEGNGTLSMMIGANEGQTMSISISDMRAEALNVHAIDVSNAQIAGQAVTTVNNAIEKVSAERSKLGAYQNRLEHTINNLGTSAENLQAAESRIRDLDMAEEIMAFTKNNILQQAATAMLAQANMAPQSVLQLLG